MKRVIYNHSQYKCYYTVEPLRLRNKSQYEEDITKVNYMLESMK